MGEKYLWWQSGVVYQIYPRSYQDSTGNGIGDLPGIISRLDHLASLGIDAIWLSPFYPSPMADFGYDVADYCDVNPMFGTLNDFDTLLTEAHARGIKIIIDLVPNHTSNEHAWFKESRSSRDNPKRDWYIWKDPAQDGGPPNNWRSFFGGPAWTLDETTEQYYMHQFVTEQPELNYRYPDVLPAMLDVLRFWLDKGVDGFRVDVIWLMMKDEQFRDEPADPNWDGVNPHVELKHIYTGNLPEVHDVIRAFRGVLDDYDERVMIGEIYLPNLELVKYYGANFDECHLPFNFQLIGMPWDAATIREAVDTYEADLPAGAWPNWVLDNHDQKRIATHAGPDQARNAAMLLLTLRGTPTMYYGEEIGMENGVIPPEKIQDPPAINQPEIADVIGRDPVRTPMQWDGSAQAGFSTHDDPWLPVAANYPTRNVAAQDNDPQSMLALFRKLLALRKAEAAIAVGNYASVKDSPDTILAYTRFTDNDRFLIALNFSSETQIVDLSAVAANGDVIFNTTLDRSGSVELGALALAANEGMLIRI